MKKINLLIIMAAAATLSVTAQSDSTQNSDEIRTIFKSGEKTTVGFYVGPELSYTRFYDKDVFLGGLGFGMIMNHSFSVGLAGSFILNPRNLWKEDAVDSQGAWLYGGYGGLKLELRVFPTSPVNVSFPVLFGGGGMVFSTWEHHNLNFDAFNDYTLAKDGFFLIEPGVMIGLNLSKFMRVDTGATYRFVTGLSLGNSDNSLLNTFNGIVSLKFGRF